MRISGSKGQMDLDAAQVASINKWNLSMARDRTDVTCFSDTNKRYVQGLPDIKGGFSGVYDFDAASPANGNSSLFDAAEGDEDVTLKLIPSSLAATNYWEGAAFIDANVDVDAKGAVTIGGSFVAAGNWSRFGA